MRLARWDPFRELEEASARLSRMMGQREDETSGAFADWAPAMDVQETDTEYLVKADLPEVQKADVKVAIDEGILSVEGERRREKEETNKKFHRVERSFGKFVRRLALPSDVAVDKVAAEFKDGVLNVHLPKSPTTKPRAIDVKVA
jgi:HSP20 family protein